MLQVSKDWQDYELIDAGSELRYERFGKYTVIRPDPQAIWPADTSKWDADLTFNRDGEGAERWIRKPEAPDSWVIQYKDLKLLVKPTSFKHMGVFPEQAANWDWTSEKLAAQKSESVKVLNLFAYAGAASLAASAAGAEEVVHLDSSKEIIEQAKQNVEVAGLYDKHIRFIVDDVLKFVKRETARGRKYHGIIMDPPKFGRGTSGQIWKLEEHLPELLNICKELLADKPLFVLVNAYATEYSHYTLENLLQSTFGDLGGRVESGELALPITNKPFNLTSGMYARWEAAS